MKQSLPQKKLLYAAIAGFALGVLWLAGIRFILFEPDTIHYHANFALYVNGEKEEFDSFTFYEEAQACVDGEASPEARVHLHDNKSHVVHVHAPGAAWSHLFSNWGFGLGDDFVKTDDGVYQDGNNNSELTFVLNGKEVSGIANTTINDEDVLLINYGDENEQTLDKRYASIPNDAMKYNEQNDPASCAGDEEISFSTRLKKAFGM